MGEIRSPYFSIDQEHLKDNAEIRSPYFSSGGDYLGVNAEIRSPYFSFDTQDYHGDNAGIHSSYFSAADYHGEDAEIPSGTFFHQDNIVENPYNAENFVEQDIVQNIYNTEKLIQRVKAEELYLDLEAEAVHKIEKNQNDGNFIYRVPDALRKSNEAIYTPQEVSIGPIHHGKEISQGMKTQKVRYLQAFCNRVVGKEKEQQMKFLEKIWYTIKEDEQKIRRCYEDGANEYAENDQFVKIVLFDAVFILEYLLRSKDIEKYRDDSILCRVGSRIRIRRDFLLLENQLPFFILEKLYDHLLEDGEGNYTSFRDLAYEYLNRYNIESTDKTSDNKQILHFTDLVRSSLSVKHPEMKTDDPIGKFYSATKLHEAAINFKELRNECLLDVRFSSTKGELRIPRLRIDINVSLVAINMQQPLTIVPIMYTHPRC
ncbi:PREDICTED: UPF0481 protein At3g47200-like [Populus euphratica]|uniref:UPF0481 protein At3g47200-like n=1 Tax=Populus euphratica TaxID=75702 RepID=A0AAJ6TJS3_POPEU|nr:PREDICTED: UPF0481 protein At3g47200-like [Populus euphratica]